MREAHDELRDAIPGVRLILAAMGPKMCALAGERYDGAFFNWMTPDFATDAHRKVSEGAAAAERETPRVYGYVRTSVGADAETRLAKEEGFYRDLHDGYRNHFERLGEPPGSVGVAAEQPDDAGPAIDAYSALDTVVVRGLASANLEAMDRVAAAAAPCHRFGRRHSSGADYFGYSIGSGASSVIRMPLPNGSRKPQSIP